MTGKVGADVDVEKAAEAARLVATNLIATMKGDLFIISIKPSWNYY